MELVELLQAVMEDSDKDIQAELTEERIKKALPEMRKVIAFFRSYPDLFVDYIKGPECPFQFYNYQRVFLRAVMRHRKVYATFPRGFSKSFLSMMALMLRCILYPNSELFITTGGKEQAASITVQKVEEICKVVPALDREIDRSRGQTKHSKDNVEYIFKNGSKINILPATERSRGQRRVGGLMEECVLIDQDALNEIIVPTTVISRRLPDGTRHPEEVVNRSQIFITTAGYKDSFAYEKLIEMLAESIMEPDEVMIMGGTYEIPVIEGLQPKNFIEELKLQGTLNANSFDREYRSIWSGDSERSYFSSESFNKCRILNQPEYEASGRNGSKQYYTLGIDVGRKDCTTEVCVFKVTPQIQGASIKSLVHIYSMEAEHFGQQAINIKKIYMKYKCRGCAIDANGLGVGLIDFMVQGQEDPETGEYFPPFGVEGGTYDGAEQDYKNYNKHPDCVKDAMFLIKANAPINTEAHSYVQTQLSSGKIRLLIDERDAKIKLMETKLGQQMTPEERAEKLQPFVLTDILKEQMANLIEENEGVNIILKQQNKRIPKDKFSAFEYGLYYIKLQEESKRKRHKRDISKMMFFS